VRRCACAAILAGLNVYFEPVIPFGQALLFFVWPFSFFGKLSFWQSVKRHNNSPNSN
jgi:hypothetical protein